MFSLQNITQIEITKPHIVTEEPINIPIHIPCRKSVILNTFR